MRHKVLISFQSLNPNRHMYYNLTILWKYDSFMTNNKSAWEISHDYFVRMIALTKLMFYTEVLHPAKTSGFLKTVLQNTPF